MKNCLMKALVLVVSVFVGFFCIVNAKNEYEEYEINEPSVKKAMMLYNSIICSQDNITARSLKNINGNNQYVLVEGDSAYLIYDTILEEFMEFSPTCNSPFENNSKYDIVYFPVGNYFYKEKDSYYSAINGELIVEEDVVALRAVADEIQNKIINNKKHYQKNNREILDSGCVSYPYYFESLINNMGSQTTYLYPGSCGYVAMEMVLSYYDAVKNDNVIGETYDVTSSKSFTSYSSISASSYIQSPGINNTFHSNLISLGRTKGYTSSSSYTISDYNISLLFEDYLSALNISCNSYFTSSGTNKVQFCKSAISSGYPVVIHITGTDTSVSSIYLDHDVVGYKYDSNGIYVNMGWQNTQTNVCISNYTIENAVYVAIDSTHSHSNNYLWTCTGCSGTICPCGNKTCSHGSYHYNQYTALKHKKICDACGHQQNESHHFQTVNGEQVCSDCGYTEANHTHNYLYAWKSYTQHRATCLCGDMHDEIHVVPANAFQNGQQYATCLLCGGQATIGVVYPNGLPPVIVSGVMNNSIITNLIAPRKDDAKSSN